jgi:hypothetical protein
VVISKPPQKSSLRYHLIGARLPVVKYMSDRAKNNPATEGKYIDPTMTPFSAASRRRFFGWLTPTRPDPTLY